MTRTPPGPLPPERARLASALRELKAGTGLSLAALAAKTTFSKSSWERYLNGRTLPPREAVQELCRLSGEPEGRCLALWELAESEWSGRAAPTTPAAPPAQPEPEPEAEADTRKPAAGGRGVILAVLASVCAIAAGGLSVALVLLAGQSGDPRPSPPPPSAPAPRCRAAACEGKSPMHMRCGESPLTLASHRTSTGAHLELRYSDKCEAGWARMWSTRIGDRLELNRTDGGRRPHAAEITDGIAAQSYVYTPMTEARPGTTVRACFRPVTGGQPRVLRRPRLTGRRVSAGPSPVLSSEAASSPPAR
ncbi:transcriptional regulator with XRE-family HTH domain [Streptomyces africanus]|uniref:Transcriptional regulator with XRE-family HTH domain n=1 Tax=Streptomyces africanus TaxID=231024 RepID=A0ABU0QTS2_9ACTN|nr:XRE family transcriptional regulator [Streptomyces africanus]MDQ0750385.1 transcriptional regulator with XRE-family HTH domain [Streptomyces africanus]